MTPAWSPGHAYGKAMRTVKSCVGTTWCRYGVQDSVQMAIDLELRYRGLRSPHKIKLAVSGCARECAEAQSKDVGVIATENGWNLYVGGNGGMRPHHAELLAEDLDAATLVRSIDRYLMWYVRTAERLERTATWQRKLPGGIDFVRRVVLDDALGIGAELEADMARHVDSYRVRVGGDARRPGPPRALRHVRQQPRARPDRHPRRDPRPAHPGGGAMTAIEEPTDRALASGRSTGGSRSACVDRLTPDRGVAALVDGRQVAVFRLRDGALHAVDNVDPCSGAAVLSRGIVGDAGGWRRSPRRCTSSASTWRTGRCLDADVRAARRPRGRRRPRHRVRPPLPAGAVTRCATAHGHRLVAGAVVDDDRCRRSARTAASAAASCSHVGRDDDGRRVAARATGDPDHPANAGRLCTKGVDERRHAARAPGRMTTGLVRDDRGAEPGVLGATTAIARCRPRAARASSTSTARTPSPCTSRGR